MTTPWKTGRPGSGRGGKFTTADHEDHLLAFVGVTLEANTKTSFGDTDAAHCDYVVCITEGTLASDALLFGTALVPSLVEGAAEGTEIVVARLGKGEAKAGQNAPWLLFDPSDEDESAVTEWFSSHAARLPSGAIVIEPPPPATAAAQEEAF